MRKLISILAFLLLVAIPSLAQNVKVEGIAAKGGKLVRTSANVQHNLMETFPLATITVYLTGSLTLAPIFSDEIGTSKANPFTAGSDASYSFYVAEGRYDIKFSGTGILSPFTLSDIFVVASGGGGGGGSGVVTFEGRNGTVVSQVGDYTWEEIDKTTSSIADITTRSATDLNTGTLPDARFPAVLPAISGINLTNLNATNISSGTLNDARLSTNVPLKNAVNVFSAQNIFQSTVGIGTSGPDRKLDILDPSNAQLRLSAVDGTVFTDLFTDSGGSFIISPTGNTIFNSTGKQINPLNTFDQSLGQINKKYLSLHAAELFVETLVAQNTIATIGGRIIVAPSNILIADLSNVSLIINVKYNNLAAGDTIYFEGNLAVEFMSVTSGATAISGGFSYSVTRNLDGTGANTWFAGDAMVNTGVSGNGFIDLYSLRGVKSSTQIGPTIVGNVRNSLTFNDWSERWAVGNLNGIYGYTSDTYGAAFGVPTGAWIKIDPTNGVRIGHNATTKTQIDAAGNATFSGTITATTGSIAGWTILSNRLENGTTYIASGFDIPENAHAWFGKSISTYYGWDLRDSGGRFVRALANQDSNFPYIGVHDGTRWRQIIGGLNHAFGSDGATNSIGMKIYSSTGDKLVQFSDLTNQIAGWSIATGKISSTGIDITSGANAYLSFGTTPPTSASTGTGIFLDRTGLYGLASNVVQAKFDASSGALTGGAGNVIIDSAGIRLSANVAGVTTTIKWVDPVDGAITNASGLISTIRFLGDTEGRLESRSLPTIDTASLAVLNLLATDSSNNSAEIKLRSYGPSHATRANKKYVTITATNGLLVESSISAAVPVASTVLELSSTTGAFLPPRMTSTQRDALTPTNGMVIYNSTTDKLQIRAAGAWVDLH